MKLSDSYVEKNKQPSLELKVRVININPSEGHEILKRCPVLKQYGQFVDMVRKYQDQGDCEAYKHAVEECIRQGILRFREKKHLKKEKRQDMPVERR